MSDTGYVTAATMIYRGLVHSHGSEGKVRRTIAVVIAAASLGAVPATAAAAASHKCTGPGVKLTVHGRIVQHFQIKLVYVCGPTGGQRAPTTLKLSGLA